MPQATRFDDDVTDTIVEAIFEPICRDYDRLAREVEKLPADGEITAHSVVEKLDGAFLGDVQDALADLAERGVLVRDREKFRWAGSPRDLSDYRKGCAWYGAVKYDKMIS
jgi:hypothetical protein